MIAFSRNVLPTFSELEGLSPHEADQIMISTNSGIAPFFRISYSIEMGLAAEFLNFPLSLKEDNNMKRTDLIMYHDYMMIGLMTFIIAFNDDFYFLENRDL